MAAEGTDAKGAVGSYIDTTGAGPVSPSKLGKMRTWKPPALMCCDGDALIANNGIAEQPTQGSFAGSTPASQFGGPESMTSEPTLSFPASPSSVIETRTSGQTNSSRATKAWYKQAMRKMHFSDPALLRGTKVGHVLRNFSAVLSQNPCKSEYYNLSEEVEKIGVFVSHNWCTPRFQKFLLLALEFNLRHAVALSLVASGLAAVFTVCGWLPTVEVTIQDGTTTSQGVCCLPIGMLVFVSTLFFFHELGRFLPWYSQATLFLDRTCVHQTNMELKDKGIEGLCAFIHNSRNFLVLYSDLYLQKLWTCYEVACFLLLRKSGRMRARFVSAPQVVFMGALNWFAVEIIFVIAHLSFLQDFFDFATAKVYWRLPCNVGVLVDVAMILVSMGGLALMAGRWGQEKARASKHVQNFEMDTAQCSCEEDREKVHKSIVTLMKFCSVVEVNAADEEALAEFEKMVRLELTVPLLASFGQTGLPYSWYIVMAFSHVFVAMDQVAGQVLDRASLRQISLLVLMHLSIVCVLWPLGGASVVRFAMQTRIRARWVLGGVGVACAGMTIPCYWLLVSLTLEAESSKVALLALLALHAMLSGAAVAVFRPAARRVRK